MRDHYQILGLTPEASFDEVRRAYRKLALEHHPDKNDGSVHSQAVFAEIAEAYSVLSNPEKRKKYHQRKFTSSYRQEPMILTPLKAYEELVKLKQFLQRADPYRLNTGAVALDIDVIIPSSIIDMIATKESPEFNKQFVAIFLDCLKPLNLDQYSNKLEKIAPIVEMDYSLKLLVQAGLKLKKRENRWERYKTLIAVILALSLCALIYYFLS